MKLVNERLPPFVRSVGPTNSLESKFRWLGFPGLIRGIAVIHFFMFLLLLFNGQAEGAFKFDWDKIREGEYWRLVSFLALPPVMPGGMVSALFMFIAMMICFLINDSLEQAWGVFRTTLYVYAILLCQVLANLLLGPAGVLAGGWIYYEAIFLAFATIFPRFEFRLFFLLPVQVWILAAFSAGLFVLQALASLHVAMYFSICFLPYLWWAVPRFLKWGRLRGQTAARQATFKAKVKSASPGSWFHKCESCGATDESHPDREFRVTADERELCDDCLEAETGSREPAGKAT